MSLRLLRPSVFILLLLLSTFSVFAHTDNGDRIQEYVSRLSEEQSIMYFDLFNMDEGDTIYIYAESYDIDTYIGVCDIACEEVFAENDDINAPKNKNSALAYTFKKDGDYSIFIADCCDDEKEGIFRIVLGLNTEVNNGNVLPVGESFSVVYAPTWIDIDEFVFDEDDPQVQQFYDTIEQASPTIYYEIEAQAGQTLYAYAESQDFNTSLMICGNTCNEPLAYNDDISDNNSNSALAYTFEASGHYRIVVADCCDNQQSGVFRLLLGYNERRVLTNSVLPNGAQIASEFQIVRGLIEVETVTTHSEIPLTDCSDIDLSERPNISGREDRLETDNFVIHYSLTGVDGTTEELVEEVRDFVEIVLEVQIAQLGWPAPPRDCGEGGDTRYDFYIMEILDDRGALGYAQPQEIIGDNLSTEMEERWAAYGYMVLDNDYDGVPSPITVMRATIAHEFHHLIQFGYDIGDEINWYYEATAVWMETKTSDAQDVVGYTRAIFDEPHLCIGSREDRSGLRIYGEWLLMDSIAQDFGDQSIQRLWEIIAREESMTSFYQFVEELGTTPEDVLRRYAIRNLLKAYANGEDFPDTVDIEDTIQDFDTIKAGRHGIEELAVQYLFIRDSDTYTFEIDDDDLSLVVVGINPDDDEIDVFELGQEGTVNTNPYDYAYLIIMNTDEHSSPQTCREADWELRVSDGADETQTEPNDEYFDTSAFEPAS